MPARSSRYHGADEARRQPRSDVRMRFGPCVLRSATCEQARRARLLALAQLRGVAQMGVPAVVAAGGLNQDAWEPRSPVGLNSSTPCLRSSRTPSS